MPLPSRLWRVASSAAMNNAWPLGAWWLPSLQALRAGERRSQGLAIVLPGVEGRGPLNWSVAQGLADSGFAGAIEVFDWTTGAWPLFPYHLRAYGRNRRIAARLAQRFSQYQDEFPDRPTFLIGHSGGGALTAWTLEALPAGRTLTACAMLGPALPATYPLQIALARVERVLWNFWTPLDVFFLGIGTIACGNLDGRHAPSGGFVRFSLQRSCTPAERQLYDERLRQHCFRPSMIKQGHFGGHMGWVNRLFVAEEVAPRLFKTEKATGCRLQDRA